MAAAISPQDRAEIDAARHAIDANLAQFDHVLDAHHAAQLSEFLDACEGDERRLESLLRLHALEAMQ